MKNRHLLGLVLALALTGLAVFGYKVMVLGFPMAPEQVADTWTIEAAVSFDGGPGSVRATLFVPTLMPGYALLEENFISRGFGFSTQLAPGGREAEWTVRRAPGRQVLYYRAVVYRDALRRGEDTAPEFPPPPVLDEPFATAMRVLVDDARERSADSVSLAAALIRRLNEPVPDQNAELFRSSARTDTELAQTISTLLAGARIPARVVRGVLLQDQARDAAIVPWLELYDGNEWVFLNPRTGERNLPPNYLAWWRGARPLLHVEGGSNAAVNLSVRRNPVDAMLLAEGRADQRGSRLVEFSPLALPVQTQAVYSFLLLIPVGALVIGILRNVIGFKTFGTFMPVLIALAFKETQLLAGLILFTLIVSLGLLVRFYLEHLRLLLVPRLSAVLIVVVLLMLAVSILAHRLGFETGLSVALFPMVILAMTIERMSIVWEERGAGEAIQQGLGSLAVASLAYLVMGITLVQHLVFVFPELLLLILAAMLLLGRYTGYRLLELRRFRAFADDRSRS